MRTEQIQRTMKTKRMQMTNTHRQNSCANDTTEKPITLNKKSKKQKHETNHENKNTNTNHQITKKKKFAKQRQGKKKMTINRTREKKKHHGTQNPLQKKHGK